jgi:hypothetical protein
LSNELQRQAVMAAKRFPKRLKSAGAVLCQLSTYARDDGTEARPSIATLAAITGKSRRTIQDAIGHLEGAGLIVRVRDGKRRGPARHPINTAQWTVSLENLAALALGKATIVAEIAAGPKRDGDNSNELVERLVARIVPCANAVSEPNLTGAMVAPIPASMGATVAPIKSPKGAAIAPIQAPMGATTAVDGCNGCTPSHMISVKDSPPTPTAAAVAVEGERIQQIGFAKGWTPAACATINQLRSSPEARVVVTAFVDKVGGTLNPPAHADAGAYAKQLVDALLGFDATVLEKLAMQILANQPAHWRDLQTVAAIAEAARKIAKGTGQAAEKSTVPGLQQRKHVRAGTPEWNAVLALRSDAADYRNLNGAMFTVREINAACAAAGVTP